jgi:HPt (histidine-containing phosphotransfer) domain-containing protein
MTTTIFKFINFAYLDSLIDGDVETKQVIISTLLEEVPEEMGQLQKALAISDWNTFHEVSHKLKSTLAYIGNDAIFEANQNMMMASRSTDNLAQIPIWLSEVENLWEDIKPELNTALEELT